MKDPFKEIADRAYFNIYHSDLWYGTARRFAEMIVQECAACCGSQADKRNIRHRFDLPIESNIQYEAPPVHNSVTSQYTRKYNIPRNEE